MSFLLGKLWLLRTLVCHQFCANHFAYLGARSHKKKVAFGYFSLGEVISLVIKPATGSSEGRKQHTHQVSRVWANCV